MCVCVCVGVCLFVCGWQTFFLGGGGGLVQVKAR